KPLPGTGTYKIADYAPGRRLTFVQNSRFREWSHAARPAGNPNPIVVRFGAFRPAQIRAGAGGRVDYLYAADRVLLDAYVHHAKRMHSVALPAVVYAYLNTRVAPFDDVRARKAVDLAIDRKAMVALEGGSLGAQTACQILPPSFPGYARNCSARRDLVEAR